MYKGLGNWLLHRFWSGDKNIDEAIAIVIATVVVFRNPADLLL
jgi:hypothetical protein